MKKRTAQQEQETKLRKRAETRLKSQVKVSEDMSNSDMKKLIHELEVHQIELKLQNEELQKSQMELEESRERYANLYDFAPVGYLTFNRDGVIQEANLTIADLLAIKRSLLINSRFHSFVKREDQDIFYLHMKRIFEKKKAETCEVKLKIKNDRECYVRLDSILVQDSRNNTLCRTAITNITERKRAEVEIRKLTQAIKVSPVIFMIMNTKGDIEYVNPKFTQVTGYLPEEVIKRNPRILKSGETATEEYKQLWETITTGGTWYGEFHNKKKSGELYWESASITAMKNPDGVITHFIKVAEDITKEKQIEMRLKSSERRFRDVATSMSDWIWEVDAQGKYTYVSNSIKNVLGYDQEELLGITPFDLMIPSEADRMAKIFTEISANKRPLVDLENWNRTKDGRDVCFLTNGVPLLDNEGCLLGYRGVDKDITARKQAHKILQQSEEKYRTLVEAIPDIVYKIDENGYFTFLNNSVRSLGYEPEELIGKHFGLLLHPDDVNNMSRSVVLKKYSGTDSKEIITPKLFDERRSDKRMTRNLEVRLVIKNQDKAKGDVGVKRGLLTSFGEIIATGDYYDNVHSNSKRFGGTVGIIIDITEKIKFQAEMMRAAQLALIGELAAGVAHEINNPIFSIINFAQLIVDESEKDSRPHTFGNMIMEEGNRIADLTANFVSLSRNTDSLKAAVSLYELISNSLKLIAVQLKKDHIIVKDNIPEEMPPLIANSQEIHQVFLNLIQNARYALNEKYPGKKKDKILEISCSKVLIEDHQYVRIIFYDHGNGIPEEILYKVKNLFFTTKPPHKGTGIGLSICENIVHSHGGRITIESIRGKFTKVLIDLPATEYTKEK